MYSEALSLATKNVFNKLKKVELIQLFYLAGGTALAIQLGHRMSIDLDFFSRQTFEGAILKKELSKLGSLTVTSEDSKTLNGILDDVKISFFKYEYGLISELLDFDDIKIADIKDIAAMKIDTIASRGSKKDFVDLYFLLQQLSMIEIFNLFELKFRGINYNRLHILKSLTFFDDAEDDPMPMMLRDVSWTKIKTAINSEVKKIT